MLYKAYGSSDKNVSVLGFGGMRFEKPENIELGAETVLHAYEQGINYFDTAPGYCEDHSEDIIGLAVKEMKKQDRTFYLSTKSSKKTGAEVRQQLENSLKRLNVDSIDFFHCWYVLTMDDWAVRKKGGVVDAILKAKEEGLIQHAAFSTHLSGPDIRTVIEEGYFEGVTLGYNASNFPYRQEGLLAAAENKMGVVVMNPLGGGVITKNEEKFQFLKVHEKQTVLEAALHFLFSEPKISSSIVGFRNKKDVDTAIATLNGFEAYTEADYQKIKSKILQDFDNLCTACMYCKDCPEGIDVWKYVETYNNVILGEKESLAGHLKYYWGADIADLDKCTQCRLCEAACTQHLPILERFEKLKPFVVE